MGLEDLAHTVDGLRRHLGTLVGIEQLMHANLDVAIELMRLIVVWAAHAEFGVSVAVRSFELCMT